MTHSTKIDNVCVTTDAYHFGYADATAVISVSLDDGNQVDIVVSTYPTMVNEHGVYVYPMAGKVCDDNDYAEHYVALPVTYGSGEHFENRMTRTFRSLVLGSAVEFTGIENILRITQAFDLLVEWGVFDEVECYDETRRWLREHRC